MQSFTTLDERQKEWLVEVCKILRSNKELNLMDNYMRFVIMKIKIMKENQNNYSLLYISSL